MSNRLGAEDSSWLHMEGPENPMVINGLVALGSTLSVERVTALLDRGLPAHFRCHLREPRTGFGTVRLTPDPAFSMSRVVHHVELGSGEDALADFVGDEISTLLDRSGPLFRVFVVDRKGDPTTLLFRVHHALADGFALMELLFSMCDERVMEHAPDATRQKPTWRARAYAGALGRLALLPPDPRTVLKSSLGHEKRVAWTAPIPLERIKARGKSAHATVNDVLVSAVAGALGTYLRDQGSHVRNVRAMVPVNLRAPGSANTSPNNHFGLVVLALPVGIRAPEERLLEVKRRMDRLKGSPEAVVAHGLLRLMGSVPRKLLELGVAFFGMKASLVLTNVPGPRAPLHLDGALIERLMFWVPQAAKMGLGISIFSYAGNVTVGVLADAGIVPDPDRLVRSLTADLGG
jgi:hypothetical protein